MEETQTALQNGYLYVATKKKYIDEALTSLRSLRRFHPDAHATLITNQSYSHPAFNRVQVLSSADFSSSWEGGLLYRVAALGTSPYQKTFFIDSDTYFTDSCQELFRLLDFFDVLVAASPADSSNVELNGEQLKGYTPYNMGVIVFRKNEKTKSLLQDWLQVYQTKFAIYPADQTAFMEAYLQSDIKLHVLQSFYNFRQPFIVALPPGKVKIIHGRPKDFVALEKQLNSNLHHRVWLPNRQKILFRKTRKLRHRIRKNAPEGLLKTYRGLKKMWGG